jgi:large subunit ribosomal protein L13
MTTNPKFARPLWHLVDARGQVLGRLATQLTHILRGKHKPTFQPNADCGDYVVVINAADVKLTGNKVTDKKYTWHTGWVGGLKQMTVKQQLAHKPEEVVRKAVLGMMPKNNLRKIIATKLRIFPGDKHLHEDMLPPGTVPINIHMPRGVK